MKNERDASVECSVSTSCACNDHRCIMWLNFFLLVCQTCFEQVSSYFNRCRCLHLLCTDTSFLSAFVQVSVNSRLMPQKKATTTRGPWACSYNRAPKIMCRVLEQNARLADDRHRGALTHSQTHAYTHRYAHTHTHTHTRRSHDSPEPCCTAQLIMVSVWTGVECFTISSRR